VARFVSCSETRSDLASLAPRILSPSGVSDSHARQVTRFVICSETRSDLANLGPRILSPIKGSAHLQFELLELAGLVAERGGLLELEIRGGLLHLTAQLVDRTAQ
jgi:hypothetical protein